MNEQQARAVLLVKAIETESTGDAFLSAAQRDAASAAALAAAPRPASAARRLEWTEAFIVRRAERLLADALARQPRLNALQGDAWLMTLLRWGLPLLGLLAGLAAEFWVSPQAIDLLSPALSLFVVWNLLVFVGLALLGLRRLLAPTERVSWLGAGLARLAWPRAWTRPLWAIARHFQRDWMRLAGPATGARMAATLHLSAALCAVGMVAALLAKGFFTEFRVGWHSQWLNAQQMHALFATVGQWLGAAPITLDDMLRLERGTGAVKADGSTWALWWSRLLLLGVAAPRLVLASLALWRARRALGSLHLDLSDPCFVRLLADHGGPATTAVVLPYSRRLTPAGEHGLATAVRERFGPSATPLLQPPVAYGDAALALPALPRDQQRQVVVLFGLAATPEAETHGAFVRQVAAAAGTLEVWLDSSAFSAHLPPGARAARLAEREALWRDFLGTTTVRVWQLEQQDGQP
ncbi:MAG: DUF2868 domain-containing protein [Hydrogenophaga sp.]|nr:DUF2868 domain-containing protein [Hydrogenophaga sp.]